MHPAGVVVDLPVEPTSHVPRDVSELRDAGRRGDRLSLLIRQVSPKHGRLLVRQHTSGGYVQVPARKWVTVIVKDEVPWCVAARSSISATDAPLRNPE